MRARRKDGSPSWAVKVIAKDQDAQPEYFHGYQTRREAAEAWRTWPEREDPNYTVSVVWGAEYLDRYFDAKVGDMVSAFHERPYIHKVQKTVYVDMDNVLVDFSSGIERLPEKDKETYKGRYDETPGIFKLMDPLPGAIDAYYEIASTYDTYILSTAPWQNPSAWRHKIEWVHRHLPEVAHKRLILSHNKHLNRGDFLIDDRPNNGADRFEGKWIHFGSEEFPNWEAIKDLLLWYDPITDPITPEFITLMNEKIEAVPPDAWAAFFALGDTARGQQASEMVSPPGQFPYHNEAPLTAAIRQWIYDQELVQSFDWGAWDAGKALADGPKEQLAEQSPVTLFALLIAFVRSDRFNEGAWAGAVERGLVSDIIDALKAQR